MYGERCRLSVHRQVVLPLSSPGAFWHLLLHPSKLHSSSRHENIPVLGEAGHLLEAAQRHDDNQHHVQPAARRHVASEAAERGQPDRHPQAPRGQLRGDSEPSQPEDLVFRIANARADWGDREVRRRLQAHTQARRQEGRLRGRRRQGGRP